MISVLEHFARNSYVEGLGGLVFADLEFHVFIPTALINCFLDTSKRLYVLVTIIRRSWTVLQSFLFSRGPLAETFVCSEPCCNWLLLKQTSYQLKCACQLAHAETHPNPLRPSSHTTLISFQFSRAQCLNQQDFHYSNNHHRTCQLRDSFSATWREDTLLYSIY